MTTPAFFADAMLGKLARRLRMLGYDTAYERVIDDETLMQRALAQHRWLLTRDRYLARRRVLRGRITLIRSDHVGDQLRQLAEELQIALRLNEQPPRCPECNVVLETISRETAAVSVPPHVACTHETFVWCPGCGRIYWPGTHWTRIEAHFASLRTR